MTEYAVLNLIEAASSTKTDIEELLRRTKITAFRLNFPEIVEWCDKELNGYTNSKTLPEYRLIRNAKIFSKNIHNGKVVEIPLGDIAFKQDETSRKVYTVLTTVTLNFSIATLKNHSQTSSHYLSVPLSPQLKQFFADMNADGAVNTYAPAFGYNNMSKEQENTLRQQASVCFEYFYSIPSGCVFSPIRNTILNYALELEKNGILGKDLRFSEEEKNKASIQHTTINNINNFHAPVENTGNISATTAQDK